MAQAASTYSLRTRLPKLNTEPMAMTDAVARNMTMGGSDDEGESGKGRNKSRRELPAGAVATLKAWLLSPEHFTHPYPTPQDQVMLMQKTGIDKKQLKNWFTNARRRIWKPMLKKQLEQGKLQATGPGGTAVAVPGVVQGLMVPAMPGAPTMQATGAPDNPHSVQAMRAHYQQAVQQQQQGQAVQQQQQQQGEQQQQLSMDPYGNQFVQQSDPVQQGPAPAQQYYTQQGQDSSGQAGQAGSLTMSNSIGSLPPMTTGSTGQMNKTDSHAVLMELFARDQDLVRQVNESARMKAAAKTVGQDGSQSQQQQQVSSQHPMKIPSQGRLVSVPTLNSWPHFSSISSLNNLGTMPGVKSITSLSGVDLANQGNISKMGNLAQVKSVESMGKNDSYAFLEVFFGDRSSTALNTIPGVKDQRGVKRERDEDNDVGLSLEDEGPSTTPIKQEEAGNSVDPSRALMQPTPLLPGPKDGGDTSTLKRAYDDALAARGLISVSRSCEKLTDLALPAKIQRTLSQQYLHHQQQQQMQQQGQTQQQQQQQTNQQGQSQNHSQQFSHYSYNPAPSPADQTGAHMQGSNMNQQGGSQQYPGQHPGQVQQQDKEPQYQSSSLYLADPSETNASVEVPAATKCAICQQTNVDTQLRPCGHMFHERCLKPSLQTPMGPPKCPVDHIPMQSALLAVPTDEPLSHQTQSQRQLSWNSTGSSSLSSPSPI